MTGGLEMRGLDMHQVVTVPQDPTVSHGQFTVRNAGTDPRWITVTGVTVTGEASAVTMERFYLYRLPTYEDVAADVIEIAPGADASFVVSFPEVPLAPGLATDIAIACDVSVDGTAVRVIIPWSYTVRHPLR